MCWVRGASRAGRSWSGEAREGMSTWLSASPCQWWLVAMFLRVSDGSLLLCPPIHGHSFAIDWDTVSHQFLSHLWPCVGSKCTSGGNYHLTSSLKPLGQIYPLLPVLDMPFPCRWQSGDVLMHPLAAPKVSLSIQLCPVSLFCCSLWIKGASLCLSLDHFPPSGS